MSQAGARRFVLAGPAGVGKTTVGKALAASLRCRFVDADDLHPLANIERMARGQPLDDAARQPWLQRVAAVLRAAGAANEELVVACSALKQSYRDLLLAAAGPLCLVQLRLDREELQRRLCQRRGHFFPPALLDDQLASEEPLRTGLVLAAAKSPAELVQAILQHYPRHA